jgi:plasmid segregation protein ParM
MTKSKAQEQIITVGVDDGFAMTDIIVMVDNKIVPFNAKKGEEVVVNGRPVRSVAIPSRARSGVHGTTAIGGDDPDMVVPCYETEGVKFTVGALSDAESAGFEAYPFSPMNRSIVHHALRVAGLAGCKVQIATGLPLSTFFKGAAPNEELLARKDRSIMTPVTSIDGSAMAEIVAHQVCPEGLSAWVDWAISDDGKLRPGAIEETTGVVDIGGRTTDVAVILPGKRVDHARSGSAEMGMHDVIEEIRVKLHKRFDYEISAVAIDQALRTGSLKMFGKPVDIRDEIDAAVQQVADGVWREVSRRLGTGLDLDRVLLVGGGAYLFRKALEARFPHVEVPADPEFANARGFAKYVSLKV